MAVTISSAKMLPFPCKCLLCGSYNRDCYNFPVTQPWNGAMLVCTICMTEIIHSHSYDLGVVNRRSYQELLSEIEKLRAQVNNIPIHVEGLIRGIRSAVDDFATSIDSAESNAADAASSINF